MEVSMYAIIQSGSKQHKVSVGDRLKVEKLDFKVGEETKFTPILVSLDKGIDLNGDQKWKVRARVVSEGKSKKILVFHKKRRKQYKKLIGHRQFFSLVEIIGIEKE